MAKKYCDICAELVLKVGEEAAMQPQPRKISVPMARPATAKATTPNVKQPSVCSRCKQIIPEDQIVWIGNHRFCQTCAKNYEEAKKPDSQADKDIQLQKLGNVLGQIRDLKQEEVLSQICFACRRAFPGDKLRFIDGEYYCEDCYSFTYNKAYEEKKTATDELYQISYAIRGLSDSSLHTRVVEIADRLLAGGFCFHSAKVGSVAACDASYADYDGFKTVGSDLPKWQQENGIGPQDCSFVCAFLSRKTLKVYIVSDGDGIVLRWFDNSDKSFVATRVFGEKVIEEVYDNRCTLTQIENMELHSEWLSNWR